LASFDAKVCCGLVARSRPFYADEAKKKMVAGGKKAGRGRALNRGSSEDEPLIPPPKSSLRTLASHHAGKQFGVSGVGKVPRVVVQAPRRTTIDSEGPLADRAKMSTRAPGVQQAKAGAAGIIAREPLTSPAVRT